MGYKSSLDKFKKTEIVSSVFSDHDAMRLHINYRKNSAKNTNTWRLNNTLLNNQEITEEIKEEIKKYLETNDNENMMTQNLWDAANAVLRGKFIAIQAYFKKQETGLPWWRSGWESACRCRGHGFEPWSGRIPRAVEQLGP